MPIWDRCTPTGNLPTWSERMARGSFSSPPNQTAAPTHINWKKQGGGNKYLKKVISPIQLKAETKAGQPPHPFLELPKIKNAKRNPTPKKGKQITSASNKEDQILGESVAPPLTHPSYENPNVVLLGDKRPKEGTDGRNTP